MPTEFETLLVRVAQGSDSAVWELLARYEKNILRVVRRQMPTSIRQKMDSSDIVQSVWKSLLRKPDALQSMATVEQLAKYLVAMAQHKIIDAHRYYTRYEAHDIRREAVLDETTEGNVHATQLDDPRTIAQQREDWNRAVAQAGPHGQQILSWRLTGVPRNEIAVRLGVSRVAVSKILDSMLQSLTQ